MTKCCLSKCLRNKAQKNRNANAPFNKSSYGSYNPNNYFNHQYYQVQPQQNQQPQHYQHYQHSQQYHHPQQYQQPPQYQQPQQYQQIQQSHGYNYGWTGYQQYSQAPLIIYVDRSESEYSDEENEENKQNSINEKTLEKPTEKLNKNKQRIVSTGLPPPPKLLKDKNKNISIS